MEGAGAQSEIEGDGGYEGDQVEGADEVIISGRGRRFGGGVI